MSELFTIRMRRKHIVSKFDKAGNKTGEYTTDLEQVIGGLPYSTVETYRAKFPDAVISVEAEFREAPASQKSYSRPALHHTGAKPKADDAKPASSRKSPSPVASPAASVSEGTYGALVNKMVSEGAAA